MDTYILHGINPGVIVNDGNATLKTYFNGELYNTVEPSENVDVYGPLAPTDLPPPDPSQTVVRVEAAGEGNSFYILSSTEDMRLGQKADIPAEAEIPDHPSPVDGNGIYGNIGDGGIDTYRTTGNLDEVLNDGNIILRVYVDGELWATVEPNPDATLQPTSAVYTHHADRFLDRPAALVTAAHNELLSHNWTHIHICNVRVLSEKALDLPDFAQENPFSAT